VEQYAEFTMRSLASSYHTVSQYTREFNFIHARVKSTDFPAPILAKRTNVQQHHLQKFLYRFSPKSYNKLRTCVHLFTPSVKNGAQYAGFHETRGNSINVNEHLTRLKVNFTVSPCIFTHCLYWFQQMHYYNSTFVQCLSLKLCKIFKSHSYMFRSPNDHHQGVTRS
jgi:hypothetical protein